MPSEGLPTLDSEQMNRILTNALCTTSLKQASLDTTTLLNEINLSYARTMNKVIFDKNKSVTITPFLENPDEGKRRGLSYVGTVEIPKHNFAEQFSNFSFNSLLTKLPVINALFKVQGECNRIRYLIMHPTYTYSI